MQRVAEGLLKKWYGDGTYEVIEGRRLNTYPGPSLLLRLLDKLRWLCGWTHSITTPWRPAANIVAFMRATRRTLSRVRGGWGRASGVSIVGGMHDYDRG